MINVNVSNNLQGVQGWSQLSNLLESSNVQGVKDATVDFRDTQILITVNDGSATRSVRISVPDLGQVDEAPDVGGLKLFAADILSVVSALASANSIGANGVESAELSAAIKNLQAVINSSVGGAQGPTANATNTSKALFDLYALMAIMVEVAQKQRDMSREIRLLENQQVQNSIKQQADDMRTAAEISLAFGIVTSVVSGLMSGWSMFKQAKAFTQQSSAVKPMETPTQNLKAAQLLTTPEAAEANFNAVQAKTTEQVRTEALEGTPNRDEFVQAIEPKKTALQEAEAEQKTKLKELLDFKTEHPNATPEELAPTEKAYNDAVTKTQRAQLDYTQTEQKFFSSLDAKQQTNETLIAAKQEELAAEEAHLKEAHGADVQTSKDKIALLKREIKGLEGQNDYLRAYTTALKAKYGSEATKADTLTAAQSRFNTAKAEVERNTLYAGSQQMMNRWMGIQQLSMTLSQMTNAVGGMAGEMVRAKATMEGVEQTQHNEQLDQIKDLYQQAETVVQAVVQLMQAVLSAENDSLMEAIRA